MALDTTVSGTTADSYISIAECNTYHNSRLHNDEWFAADTTTREKALRWATRKLDDLVWLGTATESDQALRWPRAEVLDPYGNYLTSTTIPNWLQDATAEYAWELLKADRQVDAESSGISQVTAGEVMVKFDKNDRVSKVPRAVMDVIKFYLDLTSPGASFNFAKVIRA